MQQSIGVECGVRVAVSRRGMWTVVTVEAKGLDRDARERLKLSLHGFVLGLLSRLAPRGNS